MPEQDRTISEEVTHVKGEIGVGVSLTGDGLPQVILAINGINYLIPPGMGRELGTSIVVAHAHGLSDALVALDAKARRIVGGGGPSEQEAIDNFRTERAELEAALVAELTVVNANSESFFAKQ